MSKLYVLTFKDTNEILTPASFKAHWPNYGSIGSNLQGWRPPKKIYYTLGTAKSGFSHIPDKIKPYIAISEFVWAKDVIDGAKLKDEQKVRKAKKELAYDTQLAIYRAEQEQRHAEYIRQEFEKLKKQ